MWTLLWMLACTPTPSLTPAEALDQAEASRVARQSGAAEKLLAPLRESSPDNARVWLETARLNQSVNRDEEAAKAYERAATLAPDALDVLLHHGVFILARQRNHDASLDKLRRVWLPAEGPLVGSEDLALVQSEALRNIGILYQEIEHAGLSVALIQTWRTLEGRDLKRDVIGTAVMQRVMPGAIAAAKREHEEAMQPIARKVRAESKEAITEYAAFLEAHPDLQAADLWELQLGMGVAKGVLGEHEDAIAWLDKSLRTAQAMAPGSLMTSHVELAKAHTAAGNIDKALEHVDDLLWYAAILQDHPAQTPRPWRTAISKDEAFAPLKGAKLDGILSAYDHRVK